jgi:hypothetical protein
LAAQVISQFSSRSEVLDIKFIGCTENFEFQRSQAWSISQPKPKLPTTFLHCLRIAVGKKKKPKQHRGVRKWSNDVDRGF